MMPWKDWEMYISMILTDIRERKQRIFDSLKSQVLQLAAPDIFLSNRRVFIDVYQLQIMLFQNLIC